MQLHSYIIIIITLFIYSYFYRFGIMLNYQKVRILWINSNVDDSRLIFMYHDDVQLTICEEGPFPTFKVPCSSECFITNTINVSTV